MNGTGERLTAGHRTQDPIAVEAKLLEANRRVGDAERAAAALRRRAEAAEVRLLEARDRVLQERAERDRLDDELAELRFRVEEAESALDDERRERAESEGQFTAAAHQRLDEALQERDDVETRLSSELEERDGDVRVLGVQLSDAKRGAAKQRELHDREIATLREEHQQAEDGLQEALGAAEARLAAAAEARTEHEREGDELRAELQREQERVRTATDQVAAGKAAVEQIQQRMAGELQRREQLLLSLRDAEHRSAHADRLQAQLELRERELSAARAEAKGAADATAKLQADIAVLQHQLAQGSEALQAIKLSEGRAKAALEAERSAFARERSELDDRVERAVAEAEGTMAGERSARQREREQIAASLGSLHTDIETTIGALHEKLEVEVHRTQALSAALTSQNASLQAEHQQMAEARAGVEAALQKSEARATALDEELAHRRDLMERVGEATAELRDHLDATRTALAAETARRESTELAARDVMLATQNVLLTRTDEAPTSADLATIADRGDALATADAREAPAAFPVDEPVATEPQPAQAGPAGEEIEEIGRRFERIRAQLAERGIRSARSPAGRTPGGPR